MPIKPFQTHSRRSALVLGVTLAGGLLRAGAVAHDGHPHGDGTPVASPAVPMNTGTAAVYLTIRNSGDEADRLVGATTEVARLAEFHEMSMDGGVMRMTSLDAGLDIPAGEEVRFEPAGLHIMLIDLTRSLYPDTTYPLTLTFTHVGDVAITVRVQPAPPDEGDSVTLGGLEIQGAWSRPAPRITAGTGETDPVATPMHDH